MRRPEIIERIKEALRKVAPNARAILYGSEARGDARPDSDIDLLILTEGNTLPLAEEDRIRTPLFEIEVDTGISISILMMPSIKWNSRPMLNPFAMNIQNEGIILQG